ncbi:hypothetical protein SNEBB_002811 [Seison nebaliae]|nr:hypothetical protein SNEBB_002811 [Seison nebaliae]
MNNIQPGEDLVRDPGWKPSRIKNTVGICLTISSLQIITFTPSFVDKLLKYNQCSDDVCRMVNKVNSTRTENLCLLPDKMKYVYLQHEVMLLVGAHKVNYDTPNKVRGFSYGCRSRKLGIDDASPCLHNFHRLLTFATKPVVNQSETEISLRKERINIISRNDTTYQKICNSVKYMINSTYESEMIFHHGVENHLFIQMLNAMFHLIHYLFLGPNDVTQNTYTVMIIQEHCNVRLIKGPYGLPFVELEEMIMYIIPLKFVYFNIDISDYEKKFFKYDGTLQEYVDSLTVHLFNERVFGAQAWIAHKTNTIFMHADFPLVVGIQEEGFWKEEFYASELSYRTYVQLKELSNSIIDKIKDNPRTTKQELDTLFHQIPITDLAYSYRNLKFPKEFWNEEQPNQQNLFKNFTRRSARGPDYLLYAIHLSKIVKQWKIKKDLEVGIIFGLMKEQEELYKYKMMTIISNATWYETLLTADYLNFMENNKTEGFRFVETELIPVATTHSVSIIRSLNTRRWYLINNHNVYSTINLKSFIDFQSNGELLNSRIAETFWHEVNQYYLYKNKINTIIKPIIRQDYEWDKQNVLKKDTVTP